MNSYRNMKTRELTWYQCEHNVKESKNYCPFPCCHGNEAENARDNGGRDRKRGYHLMTDLTGVVDICKYSANISTCTLSKLYELLLSFSHNPDVRHFFFFFEISP